MPDSTPTRRSNSPASSTHSLSASDGPSSEPSPDTRTVQLFTSTPLDDASRAANGTRPTASPARTPSTGRGGCWTCRIRRKKCDEQREGDSCKTCKRLRIDCLGWGTRKPEWMRDKQAVETYKAQIKTQLIQQGMVRGQRRLSLAPSSAGSSPRIGGSMSYQLSSSAGSINETFGSEEPSPFISVRRRSSLQYEIPSGLPAQQQMSADLGMNMYSADSGSLQAAVAAHHYPSPTQSSTSSPESTQFQIFAPGSQTAATFHYGSGAGNYSPTMEENSTREAHVFYYFHQVRRMQYIFAGNSVTNAFHDIIVNEPLGPVTNAVCALAAVHHARTLVAGGLEQPNAEANASTFYNQAFWQIANSKRIHGQYTEMDAIAAVHLVSFALFSGGSGEWPTALDVAREWLSQTQLNLGENPKMTLLRMSDSAKFASKATMWMDIFSSITQMQPPKFLPLYRRLFHGGGGYWAGNGQDGHDQYELRMDSLMGCPDEAMLAFAETSTLARWKAHELRRGTLSVRELIRRGDAIEQQLRQHSHPSAAFTENDQVPLEPSLAAAAASAGTLTPMIAGLVLSTNPGMQEHQMSTDELRQLVAGIFRETAVLYIQTVVNDCNPGVPEIISSVDCVIQLLNQLPHTEIDRSLVLPLCLAGCMTDHHAHRQFIRNRLQFQDENLGTVLQTRALVEAVWQRRDLQGGPVDWRETMRDLGMNILLA